MATQDYNLVNVDNSRTGEIRGPQGTLYVANNAAVLQKAVCPFKGGTGEPDCDERCPFLEVDTVNTQAILTCLTPNQSIDITIVA